MDKSKWIRPTVLLWVVCVLVMAGCGNAVNSQPDQVKTTPDQVETTPDQNQGAQDVEPSNNIDGWLQQIRDGAIDSYNVAVADDAHQSFRWGLGYLTYYGSMETIGLDNLIYNALRAHIRLATGETTAVNLPPNDNNLRQIAEGIQLDSETPPENQTAQTPAIRQAILNRVVPDQRTLSPDEALASGEIIGIIAIPSPDDLGAKYLVYTQETPDADFVFLGVVMVTDAITHSGPGRETYSFQDWQQLPWLGDAAGPFWQQIPAGLSGDLTNTAEGRPGVLFVHEAQYQAAK
ncbi:MAG: hypothetical protein IAE79_16550 [Anaerolinea sp.]|nr:hypothetical protein [Anaerolinea sp.]